MRSTVDSMTGSGLAADDLAGLLRGLDERLPERDTVLAALAEATRARSALQAERFGWDERLRERTVDDPLGVANSLTGSPDMLLGGQPGEPPGGTAAGTLDAASRRGRRRDGRQAGDRAGPVARARTARAS